MHIALPVLLLHIVAFQFAFISDGAVVQTVSTILAVHAVKQI
jgi:hypothetical protein